MLNPTHFETPAAFRAWLEQHHAAAPALLMGFHKQATGRPSLSWSESVDEALGFGWIDGVRRTVDAGRCAIHFTARRVGSNVNVAKIRTLRDQGRMRPAGVAAFETRRADRSGIDSHEQRSVELPEPSVGLLRANARAWEFFAGQSASYRKAVTWWVAGAQREETRRSRLERLIARSEVAELVPQFAPRRPAS